MVLAEPEALNDTWLYDCATRQWKELKCREAPPLKPTVFPPDDPAWVAKLKSLPTNTWAPFEYEGKAHAGQVYGQLGYVAKYGVIVNPDFYQMNCVSRTAVMRPDLTRVK
jgi:hypothetical protein